MAAEKISLPFRLEGKHALITGAGGGIGRVLVRVFQEAGARVSGADREAGLLEGLDLSHRLVFDQTDSEAAQAAIAPLCEPDSLPDIFIGNAGFTRGETLAAIDQAVWEREIAINLTGTYTITAPLARAMAARGHGTIVLISTVNAILHFGNPAYAAAKAGLVAYARALAVELGEHGVRANVICPGSVRTLAWDHRLAANPALLETVIPHYPLNRLVVPEEVANAALFLASDAASGITGVVLPVDAGLTAGNLRFVRTVLQGRP